MIYGICNPTSGHGRGKKVGELVEKLLTIKNIPFQMAYTEGTAHATVLAKNAVAAGADTVLCIGGDGTAFEVAQGLADTQTALGIIPAGTGNDFVKTICLPTDPEKALDHILSHPARKTDVGMINNRMFLNVAGAGFDVMTLDYTEKAKRYCRGILPYLYGVLQSMFRFRSLDLTYSVDGGEEIRQKAFIIAAANGGCFGGGIAIAPEARADDGLIDIVVVGHIRKRDLPARLVGLMKGKILSFPETKFYRARSVSFSIPHMRLDIDGEIIAAEKADVRLCPGALLVHR